MAETTSHVDDMVELLSENAFRGGGHQEANGASRVTTNSEHDSEVTPIARIGVVSDVDKPSHGEDSNGKDKTTTESMPTLPTTPLSQRRMVDVLGEAGGSLGGSARKPRSRIGKLYRRSASGRILLRPASEKRTPPGNLESPKDSRDGGPVEAEDVSWGMVFTSCCCHSAAEWVRLGGFFLLLLTVLYFFLVGLDLLSTGFKVAQGCTAGSLLGSDTNPLASLLIGIIATALLQSSSTTTAIVVSLVSGGLDVDQGIYIVMGANVGTSVTSMIVSLAHTRDGEELERAFAGSSLYYLFNLMTCVVLLPIEVSVHYLRRFTAAMLPSSVQDEGESWEGPIRKIVQPIVKTLIIADKDLIASISSGNVTSCSALYPVYCIDGMESYENCNRTGLIACNKDSGKCPAFFQDGASKGDDVTSGYVALLVGLFLLIFCLVALVALLHHALASASLPIIYKATSINPLLAMAIGCGVTVLVQSSSITTSALVPLCGVGIISLEHLYPLVLGADIGTTVTALMAALVSAKVESLQIALSHLFFNVTGIFLWYPVPKSRKAILRMAGWLGKATRQWRGFPFAFIVAVFFCLPLLLLGISSCFEKGTTGMTALGTFILILVGLVILYVWFWWRFKDGKKKFKMCVHRRQRRAAALKVLADDMDFMKVDLEWCRNEIGRIKDFASHLEIAPAGISHLSPRDGNGDIVATVGSHLDDEQNRLTATEEELVSIYESCHSRPWRDIIHIASGSVRASIGGSTAGG